MSKSSPNDATRREFLLSTGAIAAVATFNGQTITGILDGATSVSTSSALSNLSATKFGVRAQTRAITFDDFVVLSGPLVPQIVVDRIRYDNGVLWPDFFNIPNPTDADKNGMLRLNRVKPGEAFEAGKYKLNSVTVHHSIECQSCFITDDTGATLVYSGDTGPTKELWPAVNEVENLRGLIIEASFPNDMQQLAEVSGHMTPELMHKELEKFEPKNGDVPIYVYGMKPAYIDVVREQLDALNDERLTMLRPMDEFEL